jgi:hypothetical protein
LGPCCLVDSGESSMNRRNFFQLMWGAFAITVLGKKKLWSEIHPPQLNERRQYPDCTEAQAHKNSQGCVQSHDDGRLCAVNFTDRDLLVSCTCGRTKKYYCGEEVWYAFICNGIVILKYHKDSICPHWLRSQSSAIIRSANSIVASEAILSQHGLSSGPPGRSSAVIS